MAWLGPYLLLVSALLMELAAQAAKGISCEVHPDFEELVPIREDATHQKIQYGELNRSSPVIPSTKPVTPKSPMQTETTQFCVVLDGIRLIMSSSYLLYVSLFLWLSAVVSSFFYFQKVTIIASTIASPLGRRRMFAEINSFIAIFILAGQLTITGRFLTAAGVTTAICSAPFVAFSNIIALALWPTWISVAITETVRKVVTYVVARPGRELLFTVVSRDEKYKAKICIDVIVQRLGDATAAGLYKLLFGYHDRRTSTKSLYALPLCILWIATAFYLGRRHTSLARLHIGTFS